MPHALTTKARLWALDGVTRAGLDGPARRVYQAVSPLARRNRRDDLHLRLLLAHSLTHDANCVDVGAHGGDILELLCRYAPDGRHVAFEPLPEQAQALIPRFPDVEVHQNAVSDHAGTATFTHVTTNPQLSGLRNRGLPGEETTTFDVELVRLDDVLDPERPVALVKVDVEGAELGVFKGGLETLERWRPTIVFEHGIGGADHFGATPADVHDLLVGQLGLRIFDIDGGGPYTRSAFEAVYTEPIWLFVAHR